MGAWSALASRQNSLDAAATGAQQLVDVQEARTAIVEADAIAASSFLVGDAQAAARRPAYEARLADATQLITVVAQRAAPSDLHALGAANEAIAGYAGLVEQARANNRQGFPVGAAYQRQASALLRSDLIPALDDVDADTRVAAERRTRRREPLLGRCRRRPVASVGGTPGVVVAAVAAHPAARQRADRRRRAAPAIGLIWGAVTLASTGAPVRTTVETSLSAADAVSRARTAAFDARSAESLTLINRGNGAANEADWQLANAGVVAALDVECDRAGACLQDQWSAYEAEHRAIRELDDGGDYDGAVSGPRRSTSRIPTFTTFRDVAAEVQSVRGRASGRRLADSRRALESLRWFVLVAGLAAAASVIVGFGQRLREYR